MKIIIVFTREDVEIDGNLTDTMKSVKLLILNPNHRKVMHTEGPNIPATHSHTQAHAKAHRHIHTFPNHLLIYQHHIRINNTELFYVHTKLNSFILLITYVVNAQSYQHPTAYKIINIWKHTNMCTYTITHTFSHITY